MLYFSAKNWTNGPELWKSDGTSAGTVLVKDIYAGPDNSSLAYLTDVSGVLYFNATDEWLGNELFALNTAVASDVTAPSTVASPAAGVFSSAQSVALGCSDGGGSGCAGIFYTLDGSQPTVDSQPYQAPIGIFQTATLRYFATDVAGNQEGIQAGEYTINDGAPPIVTVVNPGGAPAQNKTVTAIATDAVDPTPLLAMTVGSTSTVCDATRTFITYAFTRFTSEADNGKRICYRGRDVAANTAYALSDPIAGIDWTGPSVTIDQDPGQTDPAYDPPITFRVVFDEAVTGFASGDVTISGTAGGTKTATVSGSGTTYTVAVTGMTSDGTVVASIAAGVATDAAGNLNAASTSTDNTVTFLVRLPQTITVTTHAPASANDGESFTVAATASSGLGVTIAGSGACSGSGTGSAMITMTDSAGLCTIMYEQLGDGAFRPAPPVTEQTAALPEQPATITLSEMKTVGPTITWSTIANADSYTVYRSPDGAFWTQIGSVAQPGLTLVDIGALQSNTVYW